MPWGSETVVAAQTGFGQAGDRRRRREAGFDLHLVKPLDPASLEEILSSLTPR